MSLKARISAPLEAGTSLLDSHQLPSHVTAALDYASQRLNRKGLQITLIVVPRQLDPCNSAEDEPLPQETAASASLPPPSTPSRSGFASAIKSLVRNSAQPVLPSLARMAAHDAHRRDIASPTFSISSSTTATSYFSSRWTSYSSMPITPATTISSIATDHSTQAPNPFGIQLVHTSSLPYRHERILRQTIEKAERKFRIGSKWLSPAINAAECNLTSQLICRSIVQNEVLFSSDGLTLLSLDHLYTFKTALANYAATDEPYKLEDAVDELRRFVLANGRRKLRMSQLLRTYEGVTCTGAALEDVARMYRRAYGGPQGEGGIESDALVTYLDEAKIGRNGGSRDTVCEDEESVSETWSDGEDVIEKGIGRAIGVPSGEAARAPVRPSLVSSKTPILKLQTTFQHQSQPRRPVVEPDKKLDFRCEEREAVDHEIEAEEDEDQTARPTGVAPRAFWNTMSIDSRLCDDSRASCYTPVGPMTPKAYDDISPITRGEWGFLMGDQMGRQVAVTTC